MTYHKMQGVDDFKIFKNRNDWFYSGTKNTIVNISPLERFIGYTLFAK